MPTKILRAIMQLFTSANQLSPIGTLKLDRDSLPFPFTINTVTADGAAGGTGCGIFSENRAFFGRPPPPSAPAAVASENFMNPMQLYPAFHDDGGKHRRRRVRAATRRRGRPQLGVDALFNHPSTARSFRPAHPAPRHEQPVPATFIASRKIFSDNGPAPGRSRRRSSRDT